MSRTDAGAPCAALSQEPDILGLLADIAERAGLVGEAPRLKLLYLIAVTRLFARPVSAVIKGPSSAGKSYLVEQMLRFLPDSAAYVLTAMSPKALAYSEEPLVHRLLVVYEAPGMDDEMASYLMRSLLSEGEIRYETVISTSNNGLRAQLIHRPGPTGLITTTTAVALHEENETRLISIPVTDSPEQTKAIMRAAAAGPGEPLDLTPWLALQQQLAGLARSDVIVPFRVELAEAIRPVAVRLRRDFPTLLTLTQAHALLHAARRERGETGAVMATLDDYGAVRELVAELMAEGVEQSVPAPVRETVAAVSDLLAGGGTTSVRKVAKALGLERSAAARRVGSALGRGFLRNANEKVGPGHELKLVVGEPLPDEQHVLPTRGELEDLCRCAAAPEGEGVAQDGSDPGLAAPAHRPDVLDVDDEDLDRWETLALDRPDKPQQEPVM